MRLSKQSQQQTTYKRAQAAKIIQQVIYEGQSLSTLLVDVDEPFVKDVSFGCIRWYYQLDEILNSLLKKPLRKKDKDIECLILVGLYQLSFQKTADHAAVNETVKDLAGLKKPWAKQLINATLRSHLRLSQNEPYVPKSLEAKNHLPRWLYGMFRKSWPNDVESIVNASVERAPMTLRVNRLMQSRSDYMQLLNDVGIEAKEHELVETAIELNLPVSVKDLPGFYEGRVSVQDAAAQLAAILLDPVEKSYVLDACAAPGGKTCHLLEYTNSIDLVAVDSSESRLKRVHENLERLSLSAKVVCADANDLDEVVNSSELFDAILLDAPCSAMGVIRRHPDIKLLKTFDDIEVLKVVQLELMSALWDKLKVGGSMLYATCSILPKENNDVVEAFLLSEKGSKVIPFEDQNFLQFTQRVNLGMQVLPGEFNMDGFYYAKLVKIAP